MKRKNIFFMVSLVFAGGIVGIAHAESPVKTKTIVSAHDKSSFAVLAVNVKNQLALGGRYEYIRPREQENVVVRLNDMQTLQNKFDTVEKMDQASKVQLFSDQEAVNAILTRRDDTRLVCQYDTPLGSHIPRTVCHPYKEVEQAKAESQQVMGKAQTINNYRA